MSAILKPLAINQNYHLRIMVTYMVAEETMVVLLSELRALERKPPQQIQGEVSTTSSSEREDPHTYLNIIFVQLYYFLLVVSYLSNN